MVDEVQVDRDVGGDLDQRGEVEHPAVKVDPACEEAQHPAPFGACGDRGPVVDTAGRRYGAGELFWWWWFFVSLEGGAHTHV